MNAVTPSSQLPPRIEIPPALPARRLRLGRALRELRALLDSPDDTEHAVALGLALGGNELERSFQRFVASPTGHELLVERPSLLATLSDRDALERLPAESLGRAYLAYIDANGFNPASLIELQDRVEAEWTLDDYAAKLDPLRRWFRDRWILTHDLFHVLTGYGTDDIGEATLLAFSLAQNGGRITALLCTGAHLEAAPTLGIGWLRYELAAYRRGRRATWLVALPWEELLPLRLDTVRRLAWVEEASVAHREGIRRGIVKPRYAA